MFQQKVMIKMWIEEQDAPNEWFLYYVITHLKNNVRNRISGSFQPENSIELHGTASKPLQGIHLKNLDFAHNERSFMDTKEPLVHSG